MLWLIHHLPESVVKPSEVKECRQALGLTQKALAERMKLSPDSGNVTVAQWESGARKISKPMAEFLRLLVQEAEESSSQSQSSKG